MKKQLNGFASFLLVVNCLNIQAATPIEQCKGLFDEALYEQAIPVCTTAAEADDRSSQALLGEIYDQAGDSVKAAIWWNKAADAGDQSARNLLALKYFYGGTVLGPENGWTKDYSKAFKIWMDDAEQEVATSQFMIGVMYQKGFGVTKDLSESWFWLKRSLGNGYKLSTDVLIEISREITPAQKQLGKTKLDEYQKQKSK